ncbi:alpha/beta hydrolase [Gordonia oryzae]|uniref:Alpha/beta hydrolase n=1 Tax=Gordonia oryzae TaxID=2487349 RepID=A0A3N4G7P2_9ACTN|nr:alpha/beta hydrolase [Gordonia oryzae]RPA58098.1 alpha/beta hydrolase [Gordonia oryzae]
MPTFARELIGRYPAAVIGSGPPLVVLTGLTPSTGITGDGFVRGSCAPLREVTGRQLIVINRRPGLRSPMTMSEMADDLAESLRDHLDGPAEVLGESTGGSIAQQLAADHPDLVGRLILVSTGCRLSASTREFQATVGDLVERGETRRAMAMTVADLVPRGTRTLAYGAGWLCAHRMMDDAAAADLVTTIRAEDGFDLAKAPPIEARTLIIGGRRDRFYDAELFSETARLIPHSTLLMVPRRGHVTVMSSPRARMAVAGFLGA